MKLEKTLHIGKFISQEVSNIPYVLEASDGNYTSSLTFNKKTLKKYGIEPSSALVGRRVIVTLDSREMKKGPGRCLTDLAEDDLLIERIEKKETQSRFGLTWDKDKGTEAPCFNRHDEVSYPAHFNSFSDEDGIQFYKLKIGLTENEYKQLKELPVSSVMKVSFKLNN